MHCCAPGGARIQDDESAALNQQGNSEDVDAESIDLVTPQVTPHLL